RLNTAGFTTNDTATEDTAQFNLGWACFVPGGCTLTQGYWKTHSEFGPAPYDAGWEEVSGSSVCSDPPGSPNASGEGADVEFFDGGQCWHEIFWDPGKGGNFYMKLAHQYMAAWLNVNAGASDDSCISGEFADAALLLEFYATPTSGPDYTIPKRGTDWCDTQLGGSACKSYQSDRQYAVYLNNQLTMYNEGDLSCADHCDDDGLSALFGTPD
ncbi:MAG: hypothetical protein RRA92_10990, partial [Gemmatimonadota bacterium]|nr:hypothetical protein [Gemmatimonadota bacterium]